MALIVLQWDGSFVSSLLAVCISILLLCITEPPSISAKGSVNEILSMDRQSPLDEILAEGIKPISLFRFKKKNNQKNPQQQKTQTKKPSKVSFSLSAKVVCSVSLSICQISLACATHQWCRCQWSHTLLHTLLSLTPVPKRKAPRQAWAAPGEISFPLLLSCPSLRVESSC